MQEKHYLVYQVTNLLNNFIYIGIHITDDINDNYMGSGKKIKEAIAEFGLENFKREILFNFKSQEEMYNKEIELVNKEFVKRVDTYNTAQGGKVPYTANTIPVKGSDGKYFRIHNTDERWINGELFHNAKGFISAKDSEGNVFKVTKEDPRWISGELVGIGKGVPKNENWKRAVNKYWKGHKKTPQQLENARIGRIRWKEREFLINPIKNQNFYKFFNNDGVNFIFCSKKEFFDIIKLNGITFKKYIDSNKSITQGKWKGFQIMTNKNLA